HPRSAAKTLSLVGGRGAPSSDRRPCTVTRDSRGGRGAAGRAGPVKRVRWPPQKNGSRRSRWSRRVTIEPGLCQDQSRQINDLPCGRGFGEGQAIASAVTSISERSTYSANFFRLGWI